MSASPQAIAALIWAIVGPPLLVYAATRPRNGNVPLHARLMLLGIVVEVAVFVSFSFLEASSPRLAELRTREVFLVHIALAGAAAAGVAWQVVSRGFERLRPWHRRTGPWVVGIWCGALLTGIYNFFLLYVAG